jgi:hypothetical protein
MLARQLAHPVGRDRRTVGIGLVVQPGQGVDEVEIIAGDRSTVVVCAIAIRHLLGKGASLNAGSSKAIEHVFTGSPTNRPSALPRRSNRPRRTGRRRAALPNHAQANRLAQLVVEFLQASARSTG